MIFLALFPKPRPVLLNKMLYYFISDPPSVFVSPENVTVNESTDVLMFCQFDANPAILSSVQW
jgi:hypothetical protein